MDPEDEASDAESGNDDVTIVVEGDSEPPEIDAGDTTVNVEVPEPVTGNSDSELDRAVATEARFGAIERSIEALQREVGKALEQSFQAEVTAEEAAEVAVESVDAFAATSEEVEALEDEIEPEPVKQHILFRPASELFGRR